MIVQHAVEVVIRFIEILRRVCTARYARTSLFEILLVCVVVATSGCLVVMGEQYRSVSSPRTCYRRPCSIVL